MEPENLQLNKYSKEMCYDFFMIRLSINQSFVAEHITNAGNISAIMTMFFRN